MSLPKFWVEHVFHEVCCFLCGLSGGRNQSWNWRGVLGLLSGTFRHGRFFLMFLESQGSDLHREFNLTAVKPTWKIYSSLTLRILGWDFTNYISEYRPNIIILQLAANDMDYLCPVTTRTAMYFELARQYVKHCESKSFIICEALPCAQPRHCCSEDYEDRWKLFNNIIKPELVHPGATGLSVSNFKDSSVWFWSHDKLQCTTQLWDGVHLSDQGQRRLYFSLTMVLRETTKQTTWFQASVNLVLVFDLISIHVTLLSHYSFIIHVLVVE